MQRIPCPERDDWRATAEGVGFTFHTINGERYWDESAYYAFTLNEIERRIEGPTGEIDAMCLELVGRAIKDEKYLRRLKIPEAFWPLLSESWRRRDASLYGRLDLSYDGWSPRNSWSTTRIRRPRSSKRRFFSGPGSNRRWSATSSRSAPTSSIQSMSA
jgi:glutathionylspermidine synthase